MKPRQIIFAALLLSFGALFSQATSAFHSANDARLLPKGQWQVGLFAPLRYGLSPNVELSAHPLWFFIIPNISAKWSHGSMSDYHLAGRHALVYPTPLLRTISKKGTGGIISPEFDTPQMLIINNELLISRDWPGLTATLSLGAGLSLRSGAYDERTSVDLPVVFPRMNVLYHGYRLFGGVDLNGRLYKKLNWQAETTFLSCPSAEADFAFEQKALLSWIRSERFQLCGGCLLTYGKYPFGEQWHLLPLIDLRWAWR